MVSTNAQNFGFQNFNIQDGLAQSQVKCLFQDSKGYLWIGTSGGGVSRYDGFVFTNYTEAEGLVNNLVSTVFEDFRNRIWIGTYKGVSIFESGKFSTPFLDPLRFNNKITRIIQLSDSTVLFGTARGIIQYHHNDFSSYPLPDEFKNIQVNDLHITKQGQLWIATDGMGALLIEGDHITQFHKKNGLASDFINKIYEDKEGKIFLGTTGGVIIYSQGKFSLINTKSGLINNFIHDILMDQDGKTWLATDGGLSVLNGNSFVNLTEKDGLSNNTVWSLLQDREKNVWIGTYRGGVDKVIRKNFTVLNVRDGLCGNVIRCILLDHQKKLWFGTDRGGLAYYNGKKVRCYNESEGLINNFVLSLYQDKKGIIWIGTIDGINFFDGKMIRKIPVGNSLKGNKIRSITEDRNGNIWFGTNNHGIFIWDYQSLKNITRADGLNSDEIMQLTCTSDGKIWIATLNGINYFDGNKLVDFSKVNGLPVGQFIYSVMEGPDNTLWFATFGDGLILANPIIKASTKEYNILRFSTQDGLSTNYLVSIVFDKDQNLWIGTEKGLNKFDYPSYREQGLISFQYFGKFEGFNETECIHNSSLMDAEGNMWFGTLFGAVKNIPQNDVNPENIFESLIYITNIQMYLEDVDWSLYSDSISQRTGLPIGVTFPPRKNHLRIHFTGICLTNPEKVRYKFMLEGYDDNYCKPTVENFANYSNLKAGSYTFKVLSCNNHGVWNKVPATFSFRIKPFFWETKIFYFSSVCILILIILTIIRIRTYRVVRNNRILEERVERRTLELNEALIKAEESDSLKTTFLANMSHEIRTPMNAIVGFASILTEPGLSEEVRDRCAGIVQSRSDDLMHIINDLLEISRIESGNVTLVKERICLNAVLDEMETEFLQKLKRNKKENLSLIAKKVLSDNHTNIITDGYILKQVFSNLIDNAIKYTESGSIRFGYHLPVDGTITCYVADTGIGISQENCKVIFQHFRQAEIPDPHKYGGTGLGLSICKGSLALLGGEIRVESEQGKGSTFYFTIPFEQDHNDRNDHHGHHDHHDHHDFNWSGKRILVVEDDPTNMDFLKIILGRTHAELITVFSGSQLKAMYDKLDSFDLVLLDVRLPDANGWDLAREIKTLRPNLPVIAQTAYAMSSDKKKSEEMGCDGYISKPIRKELLLDMLVDYLEWK